MQTKIALYDQPSMKGLLEPKSVNQISAGALKVSNWFPILAAALHKSILAREKLLQKTGKCMRLSQNLSLMHAFSSVFLYSL